MATVEATLELNGGQWKGLILHHLLEKNYRFEELKLVMEGITQHTLTKHLSELEADGIIFRKAMRKFPKS